MNEELKIIVLLHCRKLPGLSFEDKTAVRLGVQNGKDVEQDAAGDSAAVAFEIPLRVAKNGATGRPNFLGSYAHATPQQRFLYLAWSGETNGIGTMFSRVKIQLGHLQWPELQRATETGKPIEAELEMTNDKGRPVCATVKEDKIRWTVP